LRGGELLPVAGEIEPGVADLLVREGCIAAIGRDLPASPDVPELDCRDAVILPGLVQAHIHLCQTLCRGRADDLRLLDWLRLRVLPYEAALSEADITLAAQLACAELLLSGTTAILDMGTVRHQDALCQAVADIGLRATVGKAMMDYGDDLPSGLRESTADSLAESDRLCARWHGAAEGRLHYAYAPRFVLSCTDGLLKEVAERVGAEPAAGLRIHTHASEQVEEVALVRARYQQGNVEALGALGVSGPAVVLAHCVHLGESELAQLAAGEAGAAEGLQAVGVAPIDGAEDVGAVAGPRDGDEQVTGAGEVLELFDEDAVEALVVTPGEDVGGVVGQAQHLQAPLRFEVAQRALGQILTQVRGIRA